MRGVDVMYEGHEFEERDYHGTFRGFGNGVGECFRRYMMFLMVAFGAAKTAVFPCRF